MTGNCSLYIVEAVGHIKNIIVYLKKKTYLSTTSSMARVANEAQRIHNLSLQALSTPFNVTLTIFLEL